MSRSYKSKKAPGYEYWSKRPGSNKCGAVPGSFSKNQTHRLERIQGKSQIKDQQFDESMDEIKQEVDASGQCYPGCGCDSN